MSIIPLPGDRLPLSYTPLFSLSALHFSLLPFAVILSVCLSLTIFPCTCITLSTFPSYLALFPYHPFNRFASSFFFSPPASFVFSFSPPIYASPPVRLIHLEPSSYLLITSVFSVPLCRYYLGHRSLSAVPPCWSSHHLSLRFVLLWKCSDGIQPRWTPSVSWSDRAECGYNTGSGHWHWHSPVFGLGTATSQPNRQPAFTLCL